MHLWLLGVGGRKVDGQVAGNNKLPLLTHAPMQPFQPVSCKIQISPCSGTWSSYLNNYHQYGSFQVEAISRPIYLVSNDNGRQCALTLSEMLSSYSSE